MNLYLDDDSAKAGLIVLLRQTGHRALNPMECGTVGATDARHFEYATRNGLVLLTRNYDDFVELHDVVQAAGGTHQGILVIRMDNDPRRDMTDRSIAFSIHKLESANVPIV